MQQEYWKPGCTVNAFFGLLMHLRPNAILMKAQYELKLRLQKSRIMHENCSPLAYKLKSRFLLHRGGYPFQGALIFLCMHILWLLHSADRYFSAIENSIFNDFCKSVRSPSLDILAFITVWSGNWFSCQKNLWLWFTATCVKARLRSLLQIPRNWWRRINGTFIFHHNGLLFLEVHRTSWHHVCARFSRFAKKLFRISAHFSLPRKIFLQTLPVPCIGQKENPLPSYRYPHFVDFSSVSPLSASESFPG